MMVMMVKTITTMMLMMTLKPEELGAMLGSSLGKLEQEPEVLTTVLHIVLHLWQ